MVWGIVYIVHPSKVVEFVFAFQVRNRESSEGLCRAPQIRGRREERRHRRGQGGSPLINIKVKHRKNCECCPVSQLIVR